MDADFRRQWLADETEPGDIQCFRVFVPSGEGYEAAARGALAQLGRDENWQASATVDAETVGNAFREASALTMRWERCELIGSIVQWPSTTVPDGWLLCDGQELLIADYPALFDIVGVTFGGNGTTTFNLPDMRQRIPLAVGSKAGLSSRALGATGGEEKHSLSSSENALHSHSISQMQVTAAQTGAGFAWAPLAGVYGTASSGLGTAHENMPPFIALNFIIRTT